MASVISDSCLEEVVFDPQIHLVPNASPSSTFTLEDLGISDREGSTPIAGSEPFALLTQAGVEAYRRAIFQPRVKESCAKKLGQGTLLLRNVASQSKFVRDLWTHPTTMAVVSKALKVDLEVVMDCEIGHTNIQLAGEGSSIDDLPVKPTSVQVTLTEEEKNFDPLAADLVVPWHHDSYPYVCIVMLSHSSEAYGGHTYIRQGDGQARKVPSPGLGSAVVLQGGQVEHLASRALGATERITVVTSYRLARTGSWDNSFLSNVRSYDDLEELYRQWSMYRLQKMKAELEDVLSRLAIGDVSTTEVQALSGKLEAYATRTARQMVDPSWRNASVNKFGPQMVFRAPAMWRAVRSNPLFEQRIVEAIENTLFMPEMRLYVIDWSQTKARLSMRVPVACIQGTLEWDLGVEEYLFPDELVRQGLNEALIWWLDRSGLLVA